jgi:hypothetical protein
MGRARWAMLVIAVVAFGCGSGGLEIVPIEGTVTHNGEPVPNLLIYFVSTEGRPSWGVSDASGHFVLDYDGQHKGAKVGTHKIWVVDQSANIDPTIAMSGGPRPKRSPAIAEIAEKYAQNKSTLQVEVKKADRNFQLKLD